MKLKKGLLFLSFTLITLVLVPQVLAETSTPSARSNPKRQEIRVMIEEKKVERIEKLNAIRRERIMNYSNKMIVRLEATIERFEKLITRIEERVTKIKLENNNINVTSTKTILNEAKQKLALVKSDIVTLKENLNSITIADEPKVEFEKVRETLKGIQNDLKDIHSKLVRLIGDIKGLRVGENKND
ncbi:MAG: hypothetical protein ACD_19C00021G0021 [uncultured bacterium]|nr:MAG: hypothetical protein ACD_19C00021G0021 [uncultured bacterium]